MCQKPNADSYLVTDSQRVRTHAERANKIYQTGIERLTKINHWLVSRALGDSTIVKWKWFKRYKVLAKNDKVCRFDLAGYYGGMCFDDSYLRKSSSRCVQLINATDFSINLLEFHLSTEDANIIQTAQDSVNYVLRILLKQYKKAKRN